MKRLFKLLASIAVTALFTWWAFRNTDWSVQWDHLRSANYLWLLPYFGVLLGIHVARTLRWGYLLSGIERVPFRKLNEASAIGFMMLLVLPFRLGEFARPYLIAQRSQIRKSAAMTSVVLERIVDGLFVATLFFVLTFFMPGDSKNLGNVKVAAAIMFGVFAGGLAFLLFALWRQQAAVALVRHTLGRIVPRAADKAAEVVDTFVGAMRQLPDARAIAGFFSCTLVYWGLNGWGMALISRAFKWTPLTTFQGFVVLCVLVVGLMIPAAPGMMGTFQTAISFGLSLFLPAEMVNAQGLAYANVLWLTQTAQQICFGLLFMSLSQMSFREITRNLGSEATSDGAQTAVRRSPGELL